MQALAQAYKLSPLELDCVIGYTTLEYKAFVDGTAKPERLAALNSALHKLPKYNGPLYRGDYAYNNAEGKGKAASAYAVGKKHTVGFTSTGKSLADSFVPKRPTAHVYLSNRSGGDIEALSKKTWEQEVLFPENVTFEVVAVVDKRSKVDKKTKKHVGKGALQDDGHVTGKYGMPTTKEQQDAGVTTGVDLAIKDAQVKDAKWTDHYTENFSNKVWVFWKES
jgi:hypothetical protein